MALSEAPDSAVHQAGGGASETKRSVKTVDENVLRHLRRIFESHAGPEQKWESSQVKTFLRTVQHHESGEDVEELLAKPELDFSAFLAFMTSSSAAITTPHKGEDLSWPLSSYFISSSHNTYLSGNQLSSDSSAEAYTNVLLRGCRCVEIDVWDGDGPETDVSESNRGDEANDGIAKSVQGKEAKRPGHRRQGSITERLSSAVSAKLKKTTLGKKITEREAKRRSISVSPNKNGTPDGQRTPEAVLIEPRVLHGHTLTKDISFRVVCAAIRDNAFVVSDLPLIVSLEVHCSPPQQLVMLEIMKEVWKGLLLPEIQARGTELPTPEALKRKILIKVKRVPSGATEAEADSPDDEDPTPPSSPQRKGKKKVKVISSLGQLAVYTQGVSFKSFTQSEAKLPGHVFSLSEKKFRECNESQRTALFAHNKEYFMRAFPAGFRINSSNLNPAPLWGAGAQVVALNWQQADEGTMLNEGMFAGTGGYVLKPEGYRPDLKSKSLPNEIITKSINLTLTLLAAQGIPPPPQDRATKIFKPYIKVELHVDGSEGWRGAPLKGDGHEREGDYKARTPTYRGGDFDMEKEQVEFKGIGGLVEQLTFLRFTVRDNEIGRDELAAWACVRLDRLGSGYRFVHLLDAKGKVTDGLVLLKVDKQLT